VSKLQQNFPACGRRRQQLSVVTPLIVLPNYGDLSAINIHYAPLFAQIPWTLLAVGLCAFCVVLVITDRQFRRFRSLPFITYLRLMHVFIGYTAGQIKAYNILSS